MSHTLITIDGRTLDADYFVEWRPYLWTRPLLDALEFLGDLRGKHVLEIGGRAGRITSLFAMLGARVTMLEKGETSTARQEVERWKVADRVTLVKTEGGFEPIAGQQFDVLFTKSVLWSIPNLGGFLAAMEPHLAPGGKVAFLENYKGDGGVSWLRQYVVHRGKCPWANQYHGISPDQIALFRERFDPLKVKRCRFFVYRIFGHKKPR